MEIDRALQILNADQNIDVVFEGDSVWIDEINPDTNMITVHSLSRGNVMNVNVDRLHEPQ